MKLRQHSPTLLHPEILRTLYEMRYRRRRFNAEAVLEAKLELLREYFTKHKLKGAVVGVSGGIDSAVVAAMLSRLKREPNSPLEVLRLVTMPSKSDGVTGQGDSLKRAAKLCQYHLREMLSIVDVGVPDGIHPATPWSRGQAVAYQRTPVLYTIASMTTEGGYPAVVVGTTNRDEGAWLGYVGKAADGMVDLQPIADLHKSEVYALAKLLEIPEEIIKVEPTGDMFDGAPDVEVFGAPYDFVEFAILWRTILTRDEQWYEGHFWCKEARQQFLRLMSSLRRLHRSNAHKYIVGSPSVFLDVMPRYCPGGWVEMQPVKRSPIKPVTAAPYSLPGGDRRHIVREGDNWGKESFFDGDVYHYKGAILKSGASWLDSHKGLYGWEHAGDDGRWKKMKGPTRSLRCTFEDDALANVLWNEASKRLPPFRKFNDYSNTDIDGTKIWRLVGISPVFRVIHYPELDGSLQPHYDAPFIESKKRRTLMSCVIPISGEGSLVFYRDPQQLLLPQFRDYSDENALKLAKDKFITLDNEPGDIIFFDHRLIHSPVLNGPRTIIRTDVIFERS